MQDDFELFQNNFELNIDTATAHNTFLTFVLGDFNAKSNLWFKGDKITSAGSKIDGITSTFRLQQIINKPLGLILDNKLNFQEHLKNILNKVNKTIGQLLKL